VVIPTWGSSAIVLWELWDEKLAIGHAIREPRAVARLAKDDFATATALLDARHIAGDRWLTTELRRATLGRHALIAACFPRRSCRSWSTRALA
jgi:UTP:GlnB (protein PII) uridylyltransferase